jgi:peptidoglycan/LPS O-acetylase OafA/YrhL
LLLSGSMPGLDRAGAVSLAFFAGGVLLLAARSYRRSRARLLLRGGGSACWLIVTVAVLPACGPAVSGWIAALAVGLGLLGVVLAVAVGRGWRSVWWARRAEVAEAVCGAFALASVAVSSGLFRTLWELTSR